MPDLVLGLDVGTSSARALLTDLSGRSVGRAQSRLTTSCPSPGLAEQDAEEVWRHVQAVISAALEDAGSSIHDVATLGLTTQRSSVVIWQAGTGEPVSPLVLWSDLRGAARSEELASAGLLTAPFAANAKLEAVIDGVDRGRQRASRGELLWGTLDSYILYRLTGGSVHATDYSCGWSTCYLSTEDMRSWNQAAIDFQGLDVAMFPHLVDTYGELGATAQSVLGAEIPIGALVADQQSGMFAHAAWNAGDWKATFGTSATLMMSTGPVPVLDSPLVPMLQFAHREETVFAIEGMVVSGGVLLDWAVHSLGLFDSVGELVAASESVASNGGVAVLPALQGLGAPHNDATRRGAIVGLSGATTGAEVARAVLESICFRTREIAEAADSALAGSTPEALPVDGGLCVSDHFVQLLANCLGRPVARQTELEATAQGACVAAMMGQGLASRSQVAELAQAETAVEPTLATEAEQASFDAWRSAVGTD